jgi:hypothetical protein
MIRGKTLYFAQIALIADAVSAQSHTQHRNSVAIGNWRGVLPLYRDGLSVWIVKLGVELLTSTAGCAVV